MNEHRFYKILLSLGHCQPGGGFLGSDHRTLIYGKNATALGSYVPWGLWVAVFLLLLGLTAGAFLITILTYVFRGQNFCTRGTFGGFYRARGHYL